MKHKIRDSVNVIGYDKECRKCKQKLQIREHKYLTEKQKSAIFFYKKWYVCVNPKCYFLLNLEEDKVWNKNHMAIYAKSKENEADLLSFIKSDYF